MVRSGGVCHGAFHMVFDDMDKKGIREPVSRMVIRVMVIGKRRHLS